MSYSSILRIKPFRDLWLGQAISQFGDAFYYVIFMFMVEKITGNIAMVGVVGALEALPYLIFGPYAGILADRMDRRRIMLWSDLVSGGTLLLLASVLVFQGSPPLVLLLLTPFLLSSVRVFFLPAKGAALPALVPPDKVHTANAFSMMTQSFMPLIGLALSASVLGLLYAKFPAWFFFAAVIVNALSFLGSAVYIARLPQIVPERTDAHDAHPMQDVREGVAFIRARRDLMVLLVLLTLFRLFVAPFFVVYVAANKVWFGGTPQPLAWFEFSFFLGMIVASFLVGRLALRKPGVCFSVGLAAVGVAVACLGYAMHVEVGLNALGLGFTFLGVTAAFWLFVFWNVVAGLAVPFADIPINTYIQVTVPDAFRGRVNAVLSMIATGVMPIGMGLGGVLVDRVGVVNSFLIMGVGMTAASLVGLLDRTYRTIAMPPDAVHEPPTEPQPDSGEALAVA